MNSSDQFWEAVDARARAQILPLVQRNVWGTVASTNPLQVLIDGDTTVTEGLESLTGSLVVGDRVLVARYGRRALVLGRSGGWPQITWDLVDDKPTTFPPATHTHAISSITGLAAQLSPMPTAAAGGRVATSTSGETTVTYPSGRFSSTPRVTANVVSGGLVAATHIRSPSSSSFTVSAWALNTLTRIAVNVDWIAIQP